MEEAKDLSIRCGCVLQGELQTEDGFKPIQEICVGDVILGPDGKHEVMGIAVNRLGDYRFAVSPRGDRKTVLASDHIIKQDGVMVAYSREALLLNRYWQKSPTAIGSYFFPGLLETCAIDPSQFYLRNFPAKAMAYSLIVDKGRWAKTRGGSCVLLAEFRKAVKVSPYN